MTLPFLARNTKQKAGRPPGSLIFVGEGDKTPSKIELIDYSSDTMHEATLDGFPDLADLTSGETVSWVNVTGVQDPVLVQRVGDSLNIPALVLEDIMNTKHRPKIEEDSDYLFVIVKMLSIGQGSQLKVEQVSFIIGETYVVSLQEVEGDVFNPIRDRLRLGKGLIRQKGADYLAFCLLDAIVDNYFVVLEELGERMESIERKLMTNCQHSLIQNIHSNKMDLFYMRKAIWPLREIAGTMTNESSFVSDDARPYYRDLYEHTIQAIDTVETFRDVAAGITDLYMSTMGNRMNEVMQVLTIIATIFIPITFIAGIYGMNFEYIPELKFKYGYFFAWGVMIAVTLGMLAYFRRKKWL